MFIIYIISVLLLIMSFMYIIIFEQKIIEEYLVNFNNSYLFLYFIIAVITFTPIMNTLAIIFALISTINEIRND